MQIQIIFALLIDESPLNGIVPRVTPRDGFRYSSQDVGGNVRPKTLQGQIVFALFLDEGPLDRIISGVTTGNSLFDLGGDVRWNALAGPG